MTRKARSDSLEALVQEERRAELSPVEIEAGYRRLQSALRTRTRALPIAIAPLSLGTALLAAKTAAAVVAVCAGGALGTVAWAHWHTQDDPRQAGTVRQDASARRTTLGPGRPRSARPAAAASEPSLLGEPKTTGDAGSPVVAPRVHAPDPGWRKPSPAEHVAEMDPSHPTDWDVELELLQRAKSDSCQGHPDRARAWLDRHAAEHPQGVLALERETLRVIIDCSTRPGSKSIEAAERLLRDHPRSVHRDHVRRACGLTTPSRAAKSAPGRSGESTPPTEAAFPSHSEVTTVPASPQSPTPRSPATAEFPLE